MLPQVSNGMISSPPCVFDFFADYLYSAARLSEISVQRICVAECNLKRASFGGTHGFADMFAESVLVEIVVRSSYKERRRLALVYDVLSEKSCAHIFLITPGGYGNLAEIIKLRYGFFPEIVHRLAASV